MSTSLHGLNKSLPLSIRQNPKPKHGHVEFTLTMSKELAEQLSYVVVPFLRDLCDVVQHNQSQQEQTQQVFLRMDNTIRNLFFVSLKAINLVRRHPSHDLASACDELGMRHDLNPKALLNEARRLQRERSIRYNRFKERHMCILHQEGWTKKRIATHYNTTYRHVQKALSGVHLALEDCHAL